MIRPCGRSPILQSNRGFVVSSHVRPPLSPLQLGAAAISTRRITAFMAASEQRDYVTRLMQPPGTTNNTPHPSAPPSPKAHRTNPSRTSTSTPGAMPGFTSSSASASASAATSSSHHTPSPLGPRAAGLPPSAAPSLHTVSAPPAAASSTSKTTGGVSADDERRPLLLTALRHAAATAAAASTPPGTPTRRANSYSRPNSRQLSFSLEGVEPGITVVARGFRWAEPEVTSASEVAGARPGTGSGTGSGGGAGGARGGSLSRRWGSLRRGRSGRLMLDAVDAAGESMAAGAGALGMRLHRAVTRTRDLDAREAGGAVVGGSGAGAVWRRAGSLLMRFGSGRLATRGSTVVVGAGGEEEGEEGDGRRRGKEQGKGLLAGAEKSDGKGAVGGEGTSPVCVVVKVGEEWSAQGSSSASASCSSGPPSEAGGGPGGEGRGLATAAAGGGGAGNGGAVFAIGEQEGEQEEEEVAGPQFRLGTIHLRVSGGQKGESVACGVCCVTALTCFASSH